MTDLQALVSGYLAGVLLRPDCPLRVEVELFDDAAGNHQPEFIVTGRESGTRVRVRVEKDDGSWRVGPPGRFDGLEPPR